MDPHPNWARVGYQGEPGAYSEEAAIAVLPQATTIGFPTFTRAFDALASRAVAEGMVMGNGAIASAAAAKRYGLKIIAEGIQDDDTNQTRFAIVDRGTAAKPGPGLTKASLAFIGAHKPGSLVHALTCFSERGINLTRLDSRPVPNQPWQYRFYVDFEISDPQAASEALKALEEEATEFKLFGSYPAAE